MKAAPNGPDFDPRRLSIEDLADPRRVEEALTHWDELEPQLLTAIETHPQHGPRLSMLRRADRWLDRKASSLRPAGPCPESEELYDFGRGPGFGPVPSARRAEIERHLKSCRECENLVESLTALPPVPLETGAHEEHVHELAGDPAHAAPFAPTSRSAAASDRTPETFADDAPATRRRGPRALPRVAELAVAASLVLALGVWIAFAVSNSAQVGFPKAPLLRGSSGGPLYFPRDRVLAITPETRAAFPALDGSLTFEVEPQADATEYRVVLARHGSDAFAADEESLLKLSSDSPTIRGPAAAQRALEPGQYTWTARALVRGLDQVLGARDFAVVEDAEVSGRLAELASRSEPARDLAAVKLLHDHGYLGEARAIARAMPPGRERDEYLSHVPGR